MKISCVAHLATVSIVLAASSCGGEGGEGDGPDIPDTAYCTEVADWDEGSVTLEEQVLEIANQHRAQGADCGSAGTFASAPPLTMNDRLRCAARKHSADMVEGGYFAHDAPDGTGPQERIEAAEYEWSTWGENIAGGSPDAAGTMDQWMNSDGHCANIMNPAFTELGVGYVAGGEFGHTWTQVFGAPG